MLDGHGTDHYYDYREVKEHAGRKFPLNIYPCSIPLDFRQVQIHWHEELEVISVREGRGVVTVDMEPLRVQAGEAVVIFPERLHGISQSNREMMEYESIISRLSMLMTTQEDVCTAGFLQPLSQGQAYSPIHTGEGMDIYQHVMDGIHYVDILCKDKAYGYQLGVKGVLFLLLDLLAEDNIPVGGERPRRSREKMRLILEYIENHYGEKITVRDGAAPCFYSTSHFMKYFKEYVGMPFIQCLDDYRLEKAAGFLRSTTMPVTDVARWCGPDNISYFNRLFRIKYHRTPGEYRRGEQEKGNVVLTVFVRYNGK